MKALLGTRATFDDRIARAAELAVIHPAAGELLGLYRHLALFQKPIYAALQSKDDTDIRALLHYFPGLLELTRQVAPPPLAEFGTEHLQNAEAQQELLVASWEDAGEDPTSDPMVTSLAGRFYARVLLQPYAEHLATRGSLAAAADDATVMTCPFCSGRPVAGVLRGEGDGAKRWLLCSLCSTEWPFRRVLCPNCSETDRDHLPVYSAPDFEHVRVEACDRCKTYIKSVDLTRDGHAVPLVDELATVALNIWAEEHGYTKLEPNLLGL